MNTTIVNTAQCNALCFFHANFAGSETRQEFRWLGWIQWNLPLKVAEAYAASAAQEPQLLGWTEQ